MTALNFSMRAARYILLQAHKQAVTYPFYFPRELWNPTHNSKPVASVLFRAIATAAGKDLRVGGQFKKTSTGRTFEGHSCSWSRHSRTTA